MSDEPRGPGGGSGPPPRIVPTPTGEGPPAPMKHDVRPAAASGPNDAGAGGGARGSSVIAGAASGPGGTRGARPSRAPIGILLGVGLIVAAALLALFMIEPFVLNAARGMEREGKIDQEISLLREAEGLVPWSGGIPSKLDEVMLQRVETEIQADRLDVAARAFREAWTRWQARGRLADTRLMSTGVTLYARASERFRMHDRLTLAADWNDSLFVLAVRAPNATHRAAALAAFTEGLNLRVLAGDPCGALARVRWAKKGLGGVVPGLDPSIEAHLVERCSDVRRSGG